MKKRLIEFLAYLGLGQAAFEKKVGLSNGYVNSVGDSIRESSLDKITKVYPELNIIWLKTGIGSMLNSNENYIQDPPGESANTLKEIEKENMQLRLQVEMHKSEKASWEEKERKLRDEINLLNRQIGALQAQLGVEVKVGR